MNKTLLLIICDFLLLNLLALTRWEKIEPEPRRQAPVPVIGANATRGASDDLVASMRAALEEERASRENLTQQMRSDVALRDATVAQLQTTLTQTRQSAQELGDRLTNTARQVVETQTRLTETEKAQKALTENSKAAEAERRQLIETLAAEKAAAQQKEAELKKLNEANAAIEQQKREAEKQVASLSSAVKVAEAEKTLLRDNVTQLKQQVATVQKEKEQVQAQTTALAQGVTQLAVRSDELKQELRENTPIAGNQVFNEFLSNRVQVAISGVGSGFLSAGNKRKESATVLVGDGTNVVAILHVNEAPFSLSIPGFGLDNIQAQVADRGVALETGPLYLTAADPRVIAVPASAQVAQQRGLKLYALAKTPFKFPEAVLVSRGGKYYGEVEFKLDPRTPTYVKMKTRFMSRLFGEFSPSAGDLVLNKSGELLGVMVNGEYCVVLQNLAPAVGGVLDATFNRQTMGRRLEEFRAKVDRLPLPLQ